MADELKKVLGRQAEMAYQLSQFCGEVNFYFAARDFRLLEFGVPCEPILPAMRSSHIQIDTVNISPDGNRSENGYTIPTGPIYPGQVRSIPA